MLNKLSALGFPPSLVSLVESYLENSKQFVKLKGFQSDEDTIIDGVPQGSNLGPTLFLIYMNDLMHVEFRLRQRAAAAPESYASSSLLSPLYLQEYTRETFEQWALERLVSPSNHGNIGFFTYKLI